MRIALVNTNRIQPPIAPIGLDYLAEALNAAGHHADLLDLCWEPDPVEAIARFFAAASYHLVGVTLRNTDDCGYPDCHSFLPEFTAFIRAIRASTAALVVVGGVGFSVMPERVLERSGADAGLWGEGEFIFPELATRLDRHREIGDLPGLVLRQGSSWRRNPPRMGALDTLPPMTRRWADNRRYFQRGGQAGFETRRGCPARCVYCADPLAKGRRTRLRPPAAVVDEIECLLDQGIDHLHTCDGEFNLPANHALAVSREIARRGLGSRLRWYAYCAPRPFSRELARAMRAAGCAGINFGADHGDDAMLNRLGRNYTGQDVINASRQAREQGMSVMLDLLLGSPGETEASLTRGIETIKQAAPDRVGVTVGIRVYEGTPLAQTLPPPTEPYFYLEPTIAPEIFALLDRQIAGDPRFLFFDPTRPNLNYNYNANTRLIEAIAQGHRGAYWDILRRLDQ